MGLDLFNCVLANACVRPPQIPIRVLIHGELNVHLAAHTLDYVIVTLFGAHDQPRLLFFPYGDIPCIRGALVRIVFGLIINNVLFHIKF